jgi:hypothetical protein
MMQLHHRLLHYRLQAPLRQLLKMLRLHHRLLHYRLQAPLRQLLQMLRLHHRLLRYRLQAPLRQIYLIFTGLSGMQKYSAGHLLQKISACPHSLPLYRRSRP